VRILLQFQEEAISGTTSSLQFPASGKTLVCLTTRAAKQLEEKMAESKTADQAALEFGLPS
jgi:hypothetical protein